MGLLQLPALLSPNLPPFAGLLSPLLPPLLSVELSLPLLSAELSLPLLSAELFLLLLYPLPLSENLLMLKRLPTFSELVDPTMSNSHLPTLTLPSFFNASCFVITSCILLVVEKYTHLIEKPKI